MQKQKINIPYLVIQSNYSDIEVALYEQNQILKKICIDKKVSSKNLVPDLQSLLKENELEIDDIVFIGVNQGPGPFTTLRVVIATANALNFALKIPLIPINGLEGFLNENKSENYPITVALFNAYNNDVYFGISNKNDSIEIGYQNIDMFLKQIKDRFENQQIRFMGSGVNLFETNIKEILQDNFCIPQPILPGCSIEQLAKIAYYKWLSRHDITQEIVPLYLKDAIIKREI